MDIDSKKNSVILFSAIIICLVSLIHLSVLMSVLIKKQQIALELLRSGNAVGLVVSQQIRIISFIVVLSLLAQLSLIVGVIYVCRVKGSQRVLGLLGLLTILGFLICFLILSRLKINKLWNINT